MKNIKKTGHKTSKFLSMVMHLFKTFSYTVAWLGRSPGEGNGNHSRTRAWKIP